MATASNARNIHDDGRWVHPPTPEQEPLGGVVRDALDHTREILRDTVAIGAIEVRRAAIGAKHTAADVGPRIAWGTAAVVLGTIGTIVGIIALFIGAEVIIPSVAIRLGIVAGLFMLAATFGAWRAGRKSSPPARRGALTPHTDTGVAPLHPVAGIGK
jgi:hypothetical protein